MFMWFTDSDLEPPTKKHNHEVAGICLHWGGFRGQYIYSIHGVSGVYYMGVYGNSNTETSQTPPEDQSTPWLVSEPYAPV